MRLIFICVLAILIGFLNYLINPNRPIFLETKKFSNQIFSDKYLILDTRSVEEYNLSHIKNSINLAEENFETQISNFLSLWNPEKIVVIYCNFKACDSSSNVAKILKQDYGINNVVILKGDWEKWASLRE